ncbi:LysR family transcriptional regulator [Sphingomonas sp. AR_OL41]|uniref:LysR family transcriptional regulator n=1 Tax=Sphingomonas sp. AR_OL41 TaxID=3042729 RepID=UPI00247FF093|nr:LysR family transcriptional regulator [Sphingomonas sp. AR_OL41]MDH7973520.1 LysR family transcriptional regulator [Sphingomonas sp. AR_OL41]
MNSEPGWDLYRTFGAVLREGSLSGAARVLGLTQPSVARHIEALEQSIGADLFVRSQRGLSPTEAALALKPFADSLATTTAALLRTASGAAGEIAGTVRVSASEVVGIEHLPPILAQLRRHYPKLSVELVLSNTLDDLLLREADIAIRMVQPTQQALVTRKVGSLKIGLHAHRDYLDRRDVPQTMASLSAHDLIGYDVETAAIRAIAARFPALGRSAFALRTDSDVAQLAAIRAGFGIGICQTILAARDPDLVRVLTDAFDLDLGVWVTMHEDLRTSPRYRAVFDALASGLAAIVAGQAATLPSPQR